MTSWEPQSVLTYDYNVFEPYSTLMFFLRKPYRFAFVHIVRILVK